MSEPPGKRFERLEIGIVGSPTAAPHGPESRDCHHCGQPNTVSRQDCWACLKPVVAPSWAPAPLPEPKPLAPALEPPPAAPPAPAPAAPPEREPRIVVRMDGKTYTSGDVEVPPEPRQVMDALRARGLTPEVLDSLRRQGQSVRYRPYSTRYPSDGDYDFWGGGGGWGHGYGYGWPTQMIVPWYWLLLILGVAGVAAFTLFAGTLREALAELFRF